MHMYGGHLQKRNHRDEASTTCVHMQTCILRCTCTCVPAMFFTALTVRPSCWNVLPSQCNILVAVEEKLFILDQYEAILQVYTCTCTRVYMYKTIKCLYYYMCICVYCVNMYMYMYMYSLPPVSDNEQERTTITLG